MVEKECGERFISNISYGILVHAKLKAGEGNSGKVVEDR